MWRDCVIEEHAGSVLYDEKAGEDVRPTGRHGGHTPWIAGTPYHLPMHTVHVRVTELERGSPIPARLRVHAAGRDAAPLGRESLPPGVILGGMHHYIEGGCEMMLPAGDVVIEASRGPEWRPERREAKLAAGQLALRISLERVFDWRERGWYPGDTRAVGLSPHAARLEGRGEGLSVVHLLARAGDDNLLAFSGTGHALPDDECLVAVNTLNVHPALGTVALLDSHRPVFPLAASEEAEWSVRDWCGQCHRKRGLVVWPGGPGQGEALACLILGEVDAFEVTPAMDGWPLYERLLRCGVRAALVGGSGKESPARALGQMRTYARCPDGLGLAAWADAAREGRTFATNGPLLEFSYREGVARAEARAVAPFERLEIVAGGEVIAATSLGELEADFTPEATTWLAARCTGPGAWAHTSPLWVDVPGRPWRVRQDDIDAVGATLAEASAYAEGMPEKGREALRGTLRQAREVLEGRR